MRSICTMTYNEAVEIGNFAFRLFDPLKPHVMGGDPYFSSKWKLHLFEDKNCEKVAIVDEQIELHHIDDLWLKDDRLYHSSNDSLFRPEPKYDWVEINKYLVITHFINNDLDLFYKRKNRLLTIRSQIDIFDKLKQFGFFGEELVLH